MTRSWHIRGGEIVIDRPLVMGILNTTPDSFSDGGRFFSVDAAVEQGERLLAEGADILDVGGESTRPMGAVSVEAAQERRRVVPVIEALRRRHASAPISVDTVKSEVAAAAVDAGATIVNDVSGFRLDARMGAVCAGSGVGVILMHSRGTVSEMGTYQYAQYEDVVDTVVAELRDRVAAATAAGVEMEAIAVDPGIGFAKRSEHSLAVLAGLPHVVSLGFPVVVGASRKRFVGELSGVREPSARVAGSVGASVAALFGGARIFRVHDVAAHRQALDVAWAILTRRAHSMHSMETSTT